MVTWKRVPCQFFYWQSNQAVPGFEVAVRFLLFFGIFSLLAAWTKRRQLSMLQVQDCRCDALRLSIMRTSTCSVRLTGVAMPSCVPRWTT